ncbi:MAG: hypothetical protein IPL84_04065 [Chitinophagaceae bacterium]|nr:hypothetical protein [Chitinophagaceae bacterium]
MKMILKVNDELLKKQIELIEQACSKEFRGQDFSLVAQIETIINLKTGEDNLIIKVGVLTDEEAVEVGKIVSKRKQKEFEKQIKVEDISSLIINGTP